MRSTVRSTSGGTCEVAVGLEWSKGGSGDAVLYLSGSGRSLTDHPSVFDGPLAKNFCVLAHDQRGLGRSDAPPGDWTTVDYAVDAERLLNLLRIERCHVVGVSFGGMVAQHLAAQRPDLVDRLVLAATSPGGDGGSSYPIHELESYDPDERFALELELEDVRQSRAWQHTNPERVGQLKAAWQKAVRPEPPSAGERRQLDARRRHDCWHQLVDITAPTLICAGRYDGVAPVGNAAALASRIPQSRLDIFEGGHRFLRRDPLAWPRILHFLRSTSGPTRP